MITASALPRIFQCPASAVLDGVNLPSEHSAAGVEKHAELAAMVERWDFPFLQRAEVAFAYDWVTGAARELRIKDRQYGDMGLHEIPGTADAVGIDGDCAVVIDWKTGFLSREIKACDSEQLRFLALAACRANGITRARVGVAHVRYGTIDFDWHEYGADALGHAAINLANMMRAVDAARSSASPAVYEGSHCRYCPVKNAGNCPAKNAALVSIRDTRLEFSPVTHDNAAEYWRKAKEYRAKLKEIDSLLKPIEQQIEMLAKSEPIELDEQTMLGEIEVEGNEKIDGDAAAKWLADNEPLFDVVAGIEIKVTKESIKKGLKNAGVENVAKALGSVMEELRSSGIAKKEARLVVQEYAARRLGG